jgi:hypothetical protein
VLVLTIASTTVVESGATVSVCVDKTNVASGGEDAACPAVTVDFAASDGRCYTDFAGSLVTTIGSDDQCVGFRVHCRVYELGSTVISA